MTNLTFRSSRIVYYGPHACENCGLSICKMGKAFGGNAFSYPEGPIYPNTEWHPHVCDPKLVAKMPSAGSYYAVYQCGTLSSMIGPRSLPSSCPRCGPACAVVETSDGWKSELSKSHPTIIDDVTYACGIRATGDGITCLPLSCPTHGVTCVAISGSGSAFGKGKACPPASTT